ncbi:MAG: hypothetical protein QOH29_2585 [Actinomycetota bacterium]|nr:hypothetical protein [Actinomycetota bacterium]
MDVVRVNARRRDRHIVRHVGRSAGRRLLAAVTLVAAAFVGSTALAAPAFASPSGDLAAATNAARASAGLPPLAANAQLNAVAQAWANHLAAAGVLSHNPALRTQVTGWRVLGENVGMAGDVPTVQRLFMASPAHRANILDARYTQMGVGSATSIVASCNCPVLWVVVDFRLPTSAPAPSPPKPAPAPTKVAVAPVKAPPSAAAPVKAITPATPHVAKVAQAAAVPPPASVPSKEPSAAASATALTTQLAASRSPDAAPADPVGRMLTFATAVSQLAG